MPITFLASWFFATFLTLVFASSMLLYLSQDQTVTVKSSTYRLYQALPSTQTITSDSIETQDGRSKIVENFFKDYKSVLASQSKTFVAVADKYNLDYRLLPSIAMQESNGAKKMPEGSYNPFGYAIYGSISRGFSSFEEAIETVGKGLRENYLNKDLNTPFEIMTKYTPSSEEKGSPWAIGVSTFMEELK